MTLLCEQQHDLDRCRQHAWPLAQPQCEGGQLVAGSMITARQIIARAKMCLVNDI